jgi:hypothetical protein
VGGFYGVRTSYPDLRVIETIEGLEKGKGGRSKNPESAKRVKDRPAVKTFNVRRVG